MKLIKKIFSFVARNVRVFLLSGYDQVLHHTILRRYNKTGTVNICIPLYNRAAMLELILNNLKDISEKNGDFNLRLLIADYSSTDLPNIKSFVELFELRFSTVFINLSGTFSKSNAIEQMIRHPSVGMNEIVFVCDVDLKLPNRIFHKIRSAVIQARQFYAPVYSFETPSKTISFPWYDNRATGFLCVHKSDYLKMNGFVGSIYEGKTTWGHEDEYLFATLQARLRMKAYRVFEPGVVSRWHQREAGAWYEGRKASRWD
ncbi:MAG: hypothetical protein R3B54_03755 [Bdellovibrionota bacterium]